MSPVDKSPTGVRRVGPTPSVTKQKTNSQQQSLALELPDAANDAPIPASRAERLWLCIHLPALVLEALGIEQIDEACAVFDEQDGISKVLLANLPARAAGIGPGLSVNAALALLPTLTLEQRDEACEKRTLHRLAAWAERFTSAVVVEAPAVLLLELAGSLRLFGGLQALRQKIATGLEKQGFTAALAIAPTPLSATWLSRAGRRVCIQDHANLTGALSNLSLGCLDWPEAVTDSLYSMGVSQVGDCLRLPRAGFAKRFGGTRLLELDRALGRLPDPRQSYRAVERFSTDFELAQELSDRELILNACQQLLQKLEQFLLTRQQAVQRVLFSFFHLQEAATQLPLGCVQPDRAVEHWFELLRIRFEQLTLAAPVIAIRLRAGVGQALSASTGVLCFSHKDKQQKNLSIEHLVERLGARMGEDSVHGLQTVAEHRPQYAWCRQRSLDALAGTARELVADGPAAELSAQRPLWILPQPETLAERDGQPVYRGLLCLIDGPERLESGWWDGDGIARDYFVASTPQGIRLWIFQDRAKAGGWYLHGIFG